MTKLGRKIEKYVSSQPTGGGERAYQVALGASNLTIAEVLLAIGTCECLDHTVVKNRILALLKDEP